jgi:rod shape-determining protein MreC
MVEFVRRHQVVLASGLFLVLSFALLTVNRDATRRFDPLGSVFLEAVRPFQRLATEAIDGARDLWTRYLNLVEVAKENEVLRARVRELEAERQRLAEIELQNRRLEELLDFRSGMAVTSVAARVIGRDASGLFESFTLDRGEQDGVRPGMAVLCAEGVVGRIAQVSPNASRVLLVTNHNSGVDAIVQRSRARGIVEGVLGGRTVLKYVKHTEDVEVGDLVITSGLDGIYPKGVPIGRVVSVARKDFGLFLLAEVVPAVDFSRLEEVLVVTSASAGRDGEFRGAFDEPAGEARKTPDVGPHGESGG